MRTTFMTNEKRIRESKQRCSGKGTDEIYKPKWSLYTSLLFLKKACVQTNSSSNLDALEEDSQSDNQAFSTTDEENTQLADSIEKNIYFNNNLQKWTLVSDNTNKSRYSPILCQDSSTTVALNQSILEHRYCADKTQQLPIKKNVSSTHSPASNYNSRILNERVGSPCTFLSSSEDADMSDITNSESIAIRNKHVPQTSKSSPSLSSTSVVEDKNQSEKDAVFVKRGQTKKKKANIMEEAVEALKKISNETMPQVIQPQSLASNTMDSTEYLALFIAARLREMKQDMRLYCEREILRILSTAETTEMRQENI